MRLEDFWSRVDRSDTCWEWTGARGKWGYGNLLFEGKFYRAHRVAWMLTYGEIPDGLQVLHHCDNRACCRPDHLFLGTHQDNMDDCQRKGRNIHGDTHPSRVHPERLSRGPRHSEATRAGIPRGERHHRSTLTADQVMEMRAAYRHGQTITAIAAEFGQLVSTVHKIVHYQRWTHLP